MWADRQGDDMPKFAKLIVFPVGLALITGCAGRSPDPVAVVQPIDKHMTCDDIYAEVKANNAKIVDLSGDQGEKVAQNVAAGVAGLFIWPLWFAMDFQGTAGKEIAALQARNEHLASNAKNLNCSQPIEVLPAEKANDGDKKSPLRDS